MLGALVACAEDGGRSEAPGRTPTAAGTATGIEVESLLLVTVDCHS
jgi:hypothetical protein